LPDAVDHEIELFVEEGNEPGDPGALDHRRLIAPGDVVVEGVANLGGPVFGDPDYYRRFGFEPSGPLNVVYRPVGVDNPHFQVRRLPAYDPSYRGEFTYCR
jgi:hypothetical protein